MHENCNEEGQCSEHKPILEKHVRGVLGVLMILTYLTEDKLEITWCEALKGFQFLLYAFIPNGSR
jgi:hypothetical protein